MYEIVVVVNTLNRLFAGQVPPILTSMALIWLLIPNHTTISKDDSVWGRLLRIDFGGILLLGLTILLVLLPFELAGTEIPWSHPGVIGSFVSALACGLGFLLYEKRYAKEPIIPLRLIFSRDVMLPNTVVFCQAAAQLGVSFYFPSAPPSLTMESD